MRMNNTTSILHASITSTCYVIVKNWTQTGLFLIPIQLMPGVCGASDRRTGIVNIAVKSGLMSSTGQNKRATMINIIPNQCSNSYEANRCPRVFFFFCNSDYGSGAIQSHALSLPDHLGTCAAVHVRPLYTFAPRKPNLLQVWSRPVEQRSTLSPVDFLA